MSFSTFVRQQRGNLGIYVFTLWASVLTLLSLANILLLTRTVEFSSYGSESQIRVWLILALNIVFGLGFGAGAYGLWRRLNWGRRLFIGFIVLWSLFNLAVMFIPGVRSSSADQSAVSIIMAVLRFALGPILSWWYLNRPTIKSQFQTGDSHSSQPLESSEPQSPVEEINQNDDVI